MMTKKRSVCPPFNLPYENAWRIYQMAAYTQEKIIFIQQNHLLYSYT